MVIPGTVTVMESRAWGAATVLAIVFTWPKTARTDKARGQERSSTSCPAASDVEREIPAHVRRRHFWAQLSWWLPLCSEQPALEQLPRHRRCPTERSSHQKLSRAQCYARNLLTPIVSDRLSTLLEGGREKACTPEKKNAIKVDGYHFTTLFYFQMRDTQATEIIFIPVYIFSLLQGIHHITKTKKEQFKHN